MSQRTLLTGILFCLCLLCAGTVAGAPADADTSVGVQNATTVDTTGDVTLDTGSGLTADVGVQQSEFELSNLSQPSALGLSDAPFGSVEVTNTGSSSGQVEVLYVVDIDDKQIRLVGTETEVTLGPGESTTVSASSQFSFNQINTLFGGDFGTGDDVATGFWVGENLLEDGEQPVIEDELAANITILGDGPFFEVTNVDAPDEAVGGGSINVTATVTNVGSGSDTQDVTVESGGDVLGTEPGVSLSEDEAATVEFDSVPVPDGSGTVEYTVRTDDDSATTAVTIPEGLNFTVNPAEPTVGSAVTFEAVNYGDAADLAWSLGDGTTTSGTAAVTHSYSANGTYDVTLDDTAGDEVTRSVEVLADNGSGLSLDVSPADPSVGQEILFSAEGYSDETALGWEFGDGESTTGSATVTHTYNETGEYSVTLTGADGETVSTDLNVTEASSIVQSVGVTGLEVPIVTNVEEKRFVLVGISKSSRVGLDSVTVEFAGETTSLTEQTPSPPGRETWTGFVNVSSVQSTDDIRASVVTDPPGGVGTDTEEAKITVEDNTGGTYNATRELGSAEIGWIDIIKSAPVQGIFNPNITEDPRAGTYNYDIDIIDLLVEIQQSGPVSPWKEDLLVDLAAGGELNLDVRGGDAGVEASAQVSGALGAAGVTGGASIAPTARFDSDFELSEFELVTSAFLERAIIEKEIGLEQYYPDFVPDWAPSCGATAEVVIRGDTTLTTLFEDGLDPFEDLSEVGFTLGPTLSAGGGAGCEFPALNVSASIGGSTSVIGGINFAPELPPGYLGSGLQAKLTGSVTGTVELKLGIANPMGSLSASVDLVNVTVEDGNSPLSLRNAPSRSIVSTPRQTVEFTPRPAAQPAPLDGVASVRTDAAATAPGLTPATADGSVVRLTDRQFEDINPTLAPAGDQQVLLWASEPASTGSMEPTNLRIQTGSGGNWSDPAGITDNDDFARSPDLSTAGADGLVAWSQLDNASQVLDGITDPFAEFEIAVMQTTDPTDPAAWGDPVRLTDSDAVERTPAVRSLGGDQWLVVWDRSPTPNSTDIGTESVGYAVVSTAGGVSVETRGNISNARYPALGEVTADGARLAFYRPDNGTENGSVVQGTLDANGTFDQTVTSNVTLFEELVAAGDTVVWESGPADDPRVTSADATGVTTSVPIGAGTRQVGELSLSAAGDRVALTYGASSPRSDDSGLVFQVAENGTWSGPSQLVRGSSLNTSLRPGDPTPLVTGNNLTTVFTVTEGGNTSTDLFLAERPFGPAYNLSVDAPANASTGDEVTVEATVENTALDDATDPAVVEVRDDGTVLTSGSVGPLGAGENGTVTLNATVPASGDLVVALAGADPATDDGPLRKTVELTLATAGLGFGDVDVSRPDEGTLRADVTVENAPGAATADPVTVALRDGGETLATGTTGAIPANGTGTATLTFDPTGLVRNVSETLVLDPDDEFARAAIDEPTTSLFVGQPNLVVSETVQYTSAPGGVDTASVVVSNEGPLGVDGAIAVVDPSNDEVVQVVDLDVPAAVDGTTAAREVLLSLASFEPGDEVVFSAGGVRPDSDASTTAVRDTVGSFGPGPVVGDESPTDTDGDGRFEDIDGDGQLDITDVQALFDNLDTSAVQDFVSAFDFDGDDRVSIFDVQALFEELQA